MARLNKQLTLSLDKENLTPAQLPDNSSVSCTSSFMKSIQQAGILDDSCMLKLTRV